MTNFGRGWPDETVNAVTPMGVDGVMITPTAIATHNDDMAITNLGRVWPDETVNPIPPIER